MINNIIPNFSCDFKNLLFNIIIYRIYNKIETFEYICNQNINNYDIETLEKSLREIKCLSICLGSYIKWDVKKQSKIIRTTLVKFKLSKA